MLPGGLAGDIAAANTRIGYRIAKRSLDIMVAALGLAILSPVFLMIAMLIVMTSPGPAIFRQTRCGKDGRQFTCYKFRTMVTDAELIKLQLLHLNEVPGPVFKIRRDPRVTSLGRWLRKFSLDELPQLYNVLRGEMSLVGPRPALPEEVRRYSAEQRIRLLVKPGLTCLWQISGRSNVPFEQWVRLDAEYVQRQSLWLDLRILLRTIPAVLTGRGAF
jgi:exopolysaccharide biosynthesis polyprenyl glycosylphosphotransferase